MKDLLFYDIESFKYDLLIVFKTIDKQPYRVLWSTPVGSQSQFNKTGFEDLEDIIKNHTLAGFNNFNYDDPMLKDIMMHISLKNDTVLNRLPEFVNSTSLRIISGKGREARNSDIIIDSIDIMQQIGPNRPSLKQIQCNMGISIIESSIPFDIQRPLTQEERRLTELYCNNDVDSTIDVYKLRQKPYFQTKESLIQMLDESKQNSAKRWNTTTISASILNPTGKLTTWSEKDVYNIFGNRWRDSSLGIPEEAWSVWENGLSEEHMMDKGNSATFRAFGCKVVCGVGGIHGAIDDRKPRPYNRVLDADVGSMYPSIICAINALGEHTQKYDSMRQERLRIKKSDPTRAAALKLILNSVYGNFKNQYSSLYNARASAAVCIYGQIALFKLCSELNAAGYTILNMNTDGVVFVDMNKPDEVAQIKADWEKEFAGLVLEVDAFKHWYQKDVNNYIAITEDDEVKVKGGDVNMYHEDKFFSNNSCRIVHIALVEMIQKHIAGEYIDLAAILSVIMQHLDEPLLFQYTLKTGSTYAGTWDTIGMKMENKVNRVFACHADEQNVHLIKRRWNDVDDMGENFPNAPMYMYRFNGDLKDLDNTVFRKFIDLEHYANIVREKLKGWGVPCS